MDLQMLRKQFGEQSEIIDQRMADELRQAELDYTGPEQKSAKSIIKEKFEAIRRNISISAALLNSPSAVVSVAVPARDIERYVRRLA